MREGTYQRASRATWMEFRDKYESEKIDALSKNYAETWNAAANHLERVIAPKHLASIDARVISQFQAKLKAEGMKGTTLASNLRPLRAAFNWAARQGLIAKAPRIEMPKLVKGDRSMRGRPLTLEEFERMLAKVPEVRPGNPSGWDRLLRGLWLSGLRLGEAMKISWDADAEIAVRVGGRYPTLRIFGEAQKSKKDGLLPIAPEFGEFLLATPESERKGFVFDVYGARQGTVAASKSAGRVISQIGAAARVVTVTATGQTATAHDLRRAFGTRWSKRVMPVLLQRLMRHAQIETTMKFYVEHDADDISADLWNWQGSVPGSVGGFTPTEPERSSSDDSHKSLQCNS